MNRKQYPRAAAISILAQAACSTYSASLAILSLALFCFCPPASATNVRLGPFTNSISLEADTNTVLLYAVSGPVANADGSFTTIGPPKRIYLTMDGSITNNLAPNNYLATNADIAPGIAFRVPLDSGPTVYRMYDLRISGYNTFVTVYITNGPAGSVTYNGVTNALGYAPLSTNQLPALTNGFITVLEATNVSAALDYALSNTLWALTFASSNSLKADYVAQLALKASLVQATNLVQSSTNGFSALVFTNISQVVYTNALPGLTNGFIDKSYTNNAATRAELISATNGLAANSINALIATNIYNGGLGVITTNGANLTYKFSAAGTNAILAIAEPLTNGFVDQSITNNAATISYVQNATNGFIRIADAQALTNGFVDKSITNNAATKAYAQSLTNGFVDKSITNNAATVAQLNLKLDRYGSIATNTGLTLTNIGVISVGSTNFLPLTNLVSAYIGPNLVGQIKGGSTFSEWSDFDDVFGWTFYGLDDSSGGFSPELPLMIISGYGYLNLPQAHVALENGGSGEGAVLIDAGGGLTKVIDGVTHIGDASLLTNLPAAGISTNGSSANQVLASIGTETVFTNVTAVIPTSYTNGFIDISKVTNSPTLFTPTINGGKLNGVTNFGNFYFSDTFGSLINVSGSPVPTLNIVPKTPANIVQIGGNLVVATNLIVSGVIAGNGSGTSNTTATNFFGPGLAIITNIASSVASAGISSSTGTNIAAFLIGVSNAPIIATNQLLSVAKVDATNGFSTGATLTNLSIEADVNMGRDGASLVFLGRTNFIAFNNAGSGIVTNGAFVWMSALNEYTNFFNGSILTNNGSQWLAISNGVTLYSLTGASPIGTFSAVSGVAPNPTTVYTEAANDHLVQAGYLSPTNLNLLFSNATNSLISIFTNGSFTGAIAVSNGFGTNTTLKFSSASWGYNNSAGGASFSAALAGSSNTIALGTGSLIDGGQNNSIGNAGNAVIDGGLYNSIASGGGESFIGGGRSNLIDLNASRSVIVGGFSNYVAGISANSTIGGGAYNIISATGGFSVIAGGASNTVSGVYSQAAGHNATTAKDHSFIWSGGIPSSASTNSQFTVTGTNGMALNGPLILGAANTNNGIYYLSNAPFSLFAITNGMANFAHATANSNGSLVDIKFSNGVPFMTILAQ